MNNYSLITIAYKFTAEQLHFDFSTNQFVTVTKKTKRSFAGVSPKTAYKMLLESEAKKGSKVTKVTAMYSRDSKMQWHIHAERN